MVKVIELNSLFLFVSSLSKCLFTKGGNPKEYSVIKKMIHLRHTESFFPCQKQYFLRESFTETGGLGFWYTEELLTK